MSTKAERRPARVAAYQQRMRDRALGKRVGTLGRLRRLWQRFHDVVSQPGSIDTPVGLFIFAHGRSQGSRKDRLANRARLARREARNGQRTWRARREPDHVHGTVRS